MFSFLDAPKRRVRLVAICAGGAFWGVASPAPGQVFMLAPPVPEVGARFGSAVSAVPDVDGDSVLDVVVGAPNEDLPGFGLTDGRIYVYSGASGALIYARHSPVFPLPQNGSDFGVSVAGLHDVDGDGRGDILVGAHLEAAPGAPGAAGRAHLLSGATGGLIRSFRSPAERFQSLFGRACSAVPDTDGDGLDDLAIAQGNYGNGDAYIFSGATGQLLHRLRSSEPLGYNYFGETISGVPDVDGDGRGDAVVFALREDNGPGMPNGRAYVFSGATGSLLYFVVNPDPDGVSLSFGAAGITDFDGDGRGDLAVSGITEPPNDPYTDAGRVYLYSGATGQHLRTLRYPNFENQSLYFGYSVAGVPDMDGDGLGDVAVGNPYQRVFLQGGLLQPSGAVFMFSGGTGALIRRVNSPLAELNGYFGWSAAGVAGAGVGGRGRVLVGAIGEFEPVRAGRAYLFFTCPADFDGSGSVTAADFWRFIDAFFAGASHADFNANGALNSQDFFDFLTAFFTPCPPG